MPTDRNGTPRNSLSTSLMDRQLLRAFLVAAIATFAAVALSLAKVLFIPTALAILFCTTLAPVVSRIQTFGVRRLPAVALTMLAFACWAAVIAWAVSSDVRHLGNQFTKYRESLRGNLDTWVGKGSILHRLLKLEADAAPAPKDAAPTAPADQAKPADPAKPISERAAATAVVATAAAPAAQWLVDLLLSTAALIVQFLGGVSLTLALTTTLLLYGDDLRDRVLQMIGFANVTRSTRLLADASGMVASYLFWHAVANLSFGVCMTIWLYAWGVPYAMTWGIFAATARFVPYIGTWVGIAPPLALAAAVLDAPFALAVLIAGSIAIGSAFNSWIDRMLTTHATGLSAVAIVASAAFWTWLWGPLGLVLATPIAVCVAALGRHLDFVRPFAALLERDSNVEASFRFYQRLASRRYVDAAETAEELHRERGPAAFGDDALAPALVRLEGDLAATVVDFESARELRAEVAAILDDLAPPRAPSREPDALIAGVRESDALAASWLARLAPMDSEIACAEIQMMAGELAAWVRESTAPSLVLVAIDEAGLSRVRHVLKILRRDDADRRIVVFAPGAASLHGDIAENVRAWGATEFAGDFAAALRKMQTSMSLSVES